MWTLQTFLACSNSQQPGGWGGITVMGVATSEIEADEVVTSPTMISCKHLQGGPRPPDMPLRELTQEFSSGTKQVMLWGHHTLLHGGRGTLQSLYPTILWHILHSWYPTLLHQVLC